MDATPHSQIRHPDDEALDDLCRRLAEMSPSLEADGAWSGEQLSLCGRFGVYRWFVPVEQGGFGWDEPDIVRGQIRLAAACLTTTFVITQYTGACKRIAMSQNGDVRQELLEGLLDGSSFATLGISHLTTSGRHLTNPAMAAREEGDGFVLDGVSPWVTGAPHADTVVLGAEMENGRQILAALPTRLDGVSTPPTARLVGLTASQTGPLRCESVRLDRRWLLAGPVENVMQQGVGGRTGGLQTSALAVGLATAALEFLSGEADRRENLAAPAISLNWELNQLESDLLASASGAPVCTNEELRTRANSLALRSSQAALTAAKGTGYVVGHKAGRFCREALFFLVWSCPQPVLTANLCELAGIEG